MNAATIYCVLCRCLTLHTQAEHEAYHARERRNARARQLRAIRRYNGDQS